MKKVLPYINSVEDLKSFSLEELQGLPCELRDFIVTIISIKQGHLGASLGVIELAIALHYSFNTPYDNLIWDVGHQAYAHKILTGRKNKFHTNRQLNGLSGFPNIKESEFDAFGTGHSSTSISAALGMALASSLKNKKDKWHIIVIGDASIASGMAFEALNQLGVSNVNLLLILNDNSMGIDPNVGALKNHFTKLKNEKNTDNNIFQNLNIPYTGILDGHDLNLLISSFEIIKKQKGVQLLHIKTTKGKGYTKAEQDQIKWHAPGKFNKDTGDLHKNNEKSPPKYQDVFGHTLVELADKNQKIIGITPAMSTGCSLKYMMEKYPKRGFDVGISEQHAVTLSAGMCRENYIPFCNIYSTFFQRSYDQVIHDVALQNLPVIFCLDRAGIVGEDGATHHGVFDISFLTAIPNMIVFEPMNEYELRNIMYTVQLELKQPIAIRYPRGKATVLDWKNDFKKIEIGTSKILRKGNEIMIISLGHLGNMVQNTIQELPIEIQNKIGHCDLRFVKPLDTKTLHYIFSKYKKIITIENGVLKGGMGSTLLEFINENNYTFVTLKRMGVPDIFIEHGSVEELHKVVCIDQQSLIKNIYTFLK